MDLIDVFRVRAFPIFITLLLLLMSILTQGNTLEQVRKWNLNYVFLYSIVFATLLLYTMDEIIEIDNFDTKGWIGLMIIFMVVTLGYVLTFFDFKEQIKKLTDNPTKLISFGIALFILPLTMFFLLDNKTKYTRTGMSMFLLSAAGLFITLNSSDIVDKPQTRLVISIIVSVLMILGFISSWFIHYKEEQKLVFIIWLISSTLLILTREGVFQKKSILKEKELSNHATYLLLGVCSIIAGAVLIYYPVKPSFDTYSETIKIVTLITSIIILILRSSSMKGLAELVWIWLLSFVNILVIDGFVKFSQTSKLISEDYDVIANSVLNFPVFVNALMAFYTTYRGVRRSTGRDYKNIEEIGSWNLVIMTLVTYFSAFMSLLLNAGSLEEELLSERLFLMN